MYGNQFGFQMQPQYAPQGQSFLNWGQSLPKQDIVRVNGQNGAKAFQLAPNSSALLLDESAPIVWLVQTDGAGYKIETPYSITPYQTQPEPDYGDLDKRLKRLEELIDGKKSDSGSPRRNKPTGDAAE